MKKLVFSLILFLGLLLVLMPKTVNLFGRTFYRPDLNWDLGKTEFRRDLEFKLGLDLRGGIHMSYEADTTGLPEDQRAGAVSATKENIERRVNGLGVSESVVQTSVVGVNQYRILVELPGITDPTEALKTIGATAKLDFREAVGTDAASLVFVPTDLTGSDLNRAAVDFQGGSAQNAGSPGVSLQFTETGGKKFAEITRRSVGRPLAIFLDDTPVSAPTVQNIISDGRAIITGNFTIDEAKRLTNQLNAGALPVPIRLVEQKNIGATLGTESVSRSLFAGLVGLVLVWVFMLVNYGLKGLVANLALTVYVLISLAVFKLIPVTLTLAGIAGFILSIGMAVDANVLIFERIKEELRWGRSLRAALELGFHRAWTSIRDSNVSSIITATILFWFGTGSVRGFATTLIIGIIISLFTSITVTRTLLKLVYRQ